MPLERSVTTTCICNQTNQRTRIALADGSYWVYRYDQLGQVISGRRYWADTAAAGPVAGR